MISKYFKIHELVPREVYNTFPEEVCWRMLDPKLIETIDCIKEKFPEGTMTINNYMWNGAREWSGLRVKGSPFYSATSQHTLGKAIDAIFSKYSADSIREFIIANPKVFPHIKGIELGVSWLHVDCRNSDSVRMFYP